MHATFEDGLVHISSPRRFLETASKLEAVIEARGIRVVARVDHSADAAKVGLAMPPTLLLIFGNPAAGTPLMLASPTVAIDLPLKALVWQDAEERVWLSYNTADYLQQRHHVPEELVKNIAGIASICEEAVR